MLDTATYSSPEAWILLLGTDTADEAGQVRGIRYFLRSFYLLVPVTANSCEFVMSGAKRSLPEKKRS